MEEILLTILMSVVFISGLFFMIKLDRVLQDNYKTRYEDNAD